MPGSHGSLTKAGKVKMQTPKIGRTGVNSKSKKPPRMRYRELYKLRFQKGVYAGQPNSIGAKRNKYKS
ncbi:MAG: 30S ribosomal protein S30e [Candidatus Lokiarchaeota archaeon]|nr:30S ribosomal protein S30e [Candidatus Lokiarchaeota archaeon]